MYKKKFDIGDFKRRAIFENWEFTQDAGGGAIKTLQNSLIVWAKIEPRSGQQFENQAQQVWGYDAKITIRYNPIIVSSSTFVYSNARYTIQSLSIEGEGVNRFIVIRATKKDLTFSTGTVITPLGNAYVYNYTSPSGGETSFDSGLIGKTVFGAFKDGVQFTVIFTGLPVDKQVLYNPGSGIFTWGIPFAQPDETAMIQYI